MDTTNPRADAIDRLYEEPLPEYELDGLIEGRVVHYVINGGPRHGEHRPAIVVKVWNRVNGCSNLQVFFDGSNDSGALYHEQKSPVWITSVLYDHTGAPGTWHWPQIQQDHVINEDQVQCVERKAS